VRDVGNRRFRHGRGLKTGTDPKQLAKRTQLMHCGNPFSTDPNAGALLPVAVTRNKNPMNCSLHYHCNIAGDHRKTISTMITLFTLVDVWMLLHRRTLDA
jgi:hypothetical protein